MRRVARHKDTGVIYVEVVMGTSRALRPDIRIFPIVQIADMDVAGLRYATYFNLIDRLWKPWDSRFFRCLNGSPTPVIGKLPQHKVFELATQMKTLEKAFIPE